MHRRQFLARTAQAALGLPLFSLTGCIQRRKTASTAGDVHWAAAAEDLESEIPRLMSLENVPGASVALIHDAAIVWRRGFGVSDALTRAPVNESTVFQAASMSKPAFAYVALKLCEKGVIALDTPLANYGAEAFLREDPRIETITARMVLSHSSGLPNFRSRETPLKIHFSPGSRYAYSGEGYYYLQSVITHLTGKTDQSNCESFEADMPVCATDIGEFMQQNLLAPFGMTLSGYVPDDTIQPHAATGHDEMGRPLPYRRPSRPAITRYAAMGGLLTTPSDFAKFMIEILESKGPDNVRLKPESLADAFRPHIAVSSGNQAAGSWGLGWHLKGDGLFDHGGDNRGFHCHAVASSKSKAGLVIMTNGENGWKILPPLMTRPRLERLLR